MDPHSLLVQLLGSFGALLFLTSLLLMIFGGPLIIVLAIRFLWYRHVYVGRSQELEKLIWQLHRIASALESRNGVAPTVEQPAQTAAPHKVHMSMFDR